MEQYETRHYIFNYNKNSKAEKDVIEIAKYQESCLKYICSVLRIYPVLCLWPDIKRTSVL